MSPFVLRTSDQDWIKRHNGVTDADGRVRVMVDSVERDTFAGREWVRHVFQDVPHDFPNGSVMCPAAWLP